MHIAVDLPDFKTPIGTRVNYGIRKAQSGVVDGFYTYTAVESANGVSTVGREILRKYRVINDDGSHSWLWESEVDSDAH